MFSALRLLAAAVIVALCGGFLLASFLLGDQRDTEQPAIVASPSASVSPMPQMPQATRVEVPDAHFAISFPADWQAGVRPDAAVPDALPAVYAEAPSSEASCMARYVGDLDAQAHVVAYMEPSWDAFMEQWVGSNALPEDEWPEGAQIEWQMPIPAGPAARLRLPGEPLDTSYFVTDGFGVYEVACGPESADPGDAWLSIASSLELSRAERAANGELISGPPLTTATLLSRFITEAVEPGVTWIVYDNESDMTGLADEGLHIVAADDGSMWHFNGQDMKPFGGQGFDWGPEPDDYDDDPPWNEGVWYGAIDVAPGNTIWAVRPQSGGPPELRSLDHIQLRGDDEVVWTLRKAAPEGGSVDGVDVQPGGDVWAWWSDAEGTTTIGRLEGDEWRTVTALEATFVADSADEDGGAPTRRWPAIAIRDGVIWALSGDPVRLQRYDAGAWHEQAVPSDADWDIRTEDGHGLLVGPAGQVWVDVEWCGPFLEGSDWVVCTPGLARFGDGRWTVWDWAAEPPHVPGTLGFEPGSPVAIAPDGRVWFATDTGAVWFDGTMWGRYLPGLNVYALAVAPDGAIWVNAGQVRTVNAGGGGETDYGPTEYYVIEPAPLDGPGRSIEG